MAATLSWAGNRWCSLWNSSQLPFIVALVLQIYAQQADLPSFYFPHFYALPPFFLGEIRNKLKMAVLSPFSDWFWTIHL